MIDGGSLCDFMGDKKRNNMFELIPWKRNSTNSVATMNHLPHQAGKILDADLKGLQEIRAELVKLNEEILLALQDKADVYFCRDFLKNNFPIKAVDLSDF